MSRSAWSMLFTLAATTALTACSGSSSTTTAPATNPSRTQVVAVSPVGGATGIDPAAPIVVSFSHAMRAGAQIYVSLHEGTVTGAIVSGTATWSTDSMKLTFMPSTPLKAHTTYALHMGGDMMDDRGDAVDLSTCTQFGGQAATGQMMGSGGMMGGGEMGSGWQTPGSSTYGMVFTFTTG
ncbi:MAG TPA: Ig-like domain-containing protein [Gemmatimonadaceae bacterium]|nr:Ig-like domain-containing protein [Gemmatimonadaceae bacterium]